MKKRLLIAIFAFTFLVTGCMELDISSTFRLDGTASMEIGVVYNIPEDEFEDMKPFVESGENEVEESLNTIRGISGVTSAEVINIDEVRDGIVRLGTRYIIEIDEISSYRDVMYEIIGYEFEVTQSGDEYRLFLDLSEMDGDDPEGFTDEEFEMESYLRFNVEGMVTDHNATSVSGNIYEWRDGSMGDEVYISFINQQETQEEVVDQPQVDERPNDQQEESDDVVDAEIISDTSNNDIDDDTTKIIVLGVVFGLVAILSLVALKVSKNGL